MPRLTVALAIIAASVWSTAASAQSAVRPVHNGLIVYVGAGADGVTQVFTIEATGRHRRQLTFDAGDKSYPAWSSDGKRIAFTSSRTGSPQLWTMDASGGHQRRLTNMPVGAGMVPSWSPDDRRIAFSAVTQFPTTIGPVIGGIEIWVIRADGRGARRLTDTFPPTRSSNAPSWSPDGRRIAFASDRTGIPQVYTMRTDGSDTRELTGPTAPIFPSSNVPVWSPDGHVLAFWSGIEALFGQVWVMAADGRGRHAITNCQLPANCDDPAWSPDGRWILFDTNRANREETWVMKADGSDQHFLLPFAYGAGRRPWQPVPG